MSKYSLSGATMTSCFRVLTRRKLRSFCNEWSNAQNAWGRRRMTAPRFCEGSTHISIYGSNDAASLHGKLSKQTCT